MRKIEIELDLNNASDEELIAYATLLKAKKTPGKSAPIKGSIEEEIEQNVQPDDSIERYKYATRVPIKVRANQIISYCRQHDWITLGNLKRFNVPGGGTMTKIRAVLLSHKNLIKKRFDNEIYLIYNNKQAESKLDKLQKVKNHLGEEVDKYNIPRARKKQKKHRDKSGYNRFRSAKLSQYLSSGMSHEDAFKKVVKEWNLLKKREELSPEIAKDFPEIAGLDNKYLKILVDMLTRIAELGGGLGYNETRYVFNISGAKRWDDFISDIFLKSDAICEILKITNNFTIEGEGRNKTLQYQK